MYDYGGDWSSAEIYSSSEGMAYRTFILFPLQAPFSDPISDTRHVKVPSFVVTFDSFDKFGWWRYLVHLLLHLFILYTVHSLVQVDPVSDFRLALDFHIRQLIGSLAEGKISERCC
jgi:hypothetical protein